MRDNRDPFDHATPLSFTTAPDLGGEDTYATGDQRNRSVVNGIWQRPYDFQVSGLSFYGSGLRSGTTWGGDLRLQGGHANYGGYSTSQSLANYGQPTSVSNVAYYPASASPFKVAGGLEHVVVRGFMPPGTCTGGQAKSFPCAAVLGYKLRG